MLAHTVETKDVIKERKKQPHFYIGARELIKEPSKQPETLKLNLFAQQLKHMRENLRVICDPRTTKPDRATRRVNLISEYQDILKILVLAECSYWYLLFLKEQMPELYEKQVFAKTIDLKDDRPTLIFEHIQNADKGIINDPIDALIFKSLKYSAATTGTLVNLQQIEQNSIRNVRLINVVNSSNKCDLTHVFNIFKSNIENMRMQRFYR